VITQHKKKFILYISFLSVSALLTANVCVADVKKNSLRVTANNIKANEGQVIFNLFKPGDDLLHEPSMQRRAALTSTNDIAVTFDDLAYGHYVVFAFHDKNNNGTLDHNFIGMPNEPMGYSNNWNFGLFTGMPNFDKTEFYFSEKKNSISIKLK
jgi:uncharacterized protein (DUF2141 family)